MKLGLLMILVSGCAAAPRAEAPPSPRADERFAIVVSIDGLMPESYIAPDGLDLRVPTLRALAAAGLVSPGARPVFPTVTYPNHTSMATGVLPAVHGIFGNELFDPEEKNQNGWYWYAEDIRVPTLWDAAAARGMRTALVSWPVTVGAHVTALVPEFWRAGTADDQKLLRAVSSPGALDWTLAEHPDLWSKLTPPKQKDEGTVDVAVTLIGRVRPNLAMVHIFETDDNQHDSGPRSPEALAAIEHADTQLGRIVAAARAAGTWERTMLVVVSDHGFMPVEQQLRPSALLRQRGYLQLDEAGKVVSWRAATLVNGASAYVYLREPGDAQLAREVTALFAELAGVPGSGVRRTLSSEELRSRGGDPRALLAIEAADGWSFKGGAAGPATFANTNRGAHGYGEDRPEMSASLIVVAPGIAPRIVEGARLIDVAPTVGEWLGVPMTRATGRSLLPGPR